LQLDDPDLAPTTVRAHLADCMSCRDWLHRLVQLEKQVGHLPIPPARNKAVFLAGLVAPVPKSLLRGPATRRTWSWVVAAAAACLVVGVTVWAWPKARVVDTTVAMTRAYVADPLVKSLVQRDLHLATARSPSERVTTLADVVEDLHREASALAQMAATTELKGLAQLLQQVIRECTGRHAAALSADERRRVLEPRSTQLDRAGQDAAVWVRANAAPAVPPPEEHVESLRRYQRNAVLIQTLVTQGLALALESNPLKRGDLCRGITECLAGELDLAALGNEPERAAELGQHLGAWLEGGVAVNLAVERKDVHAGSARERELFDVGARSAEATATVEERLRQSETKDDGIRVALLAVQKGRSRVEDAIRRP
jgi:hypothetical protein